MRLILIRHLTTAMNQAGMLQGRRDEPVLTPSPEDLATIARNRRTLSRYPDLDAVLISSLRRTLMTAEHYGFAEECRVEPLLDEFNFGYFEGRPKVEMLAKIGCYWLHEPHRLALGEPIKELELRVRNFLTKYQEQSILAFGHGTWIRAAMAIANDGSIARMNQLAINNNELVII
jgi:broad specificity phosphatase PhoE